MTISSQQVDALLTMLAFTKDKEENCDGCLIKMAEFAENSLAGKSIPDGLRSIDEHLKICGECREEFETLKVVLSNDVDE